MLEEIKNATKNNDTNKLSNIIIECMNNPEKMEEFNKEFSTFKLINGLSDIMFKTMLETYNNLKIMSSNELIANLKESLNVERDDEEINYVSKLLTTISVYLAFIKTKNNDKLNYLKEIIKNL